MLFQTILRTHSNISESSSVPCSVQHFQQKTIGQSPTTKRPQKTMTHITPTKPSTAAYPQHTPTNGRPKTLTSHGVPPTTHDAPQHDRPEGSGYLADIERVFRHRNRAEPWLLAKILLVDTKSFGTGSGSHFPPPRNTRRARKMYNPDEDTSRMTDATKSPNDK
jgi:hypothetical protein